MLQRPQVDLGCASLSHLLDRANDSHDRFDILLVTAENQQVEIGHRLESHIAFEGIEEGRQPILGDRLPASASSIAPG